MTPLPQPSLPDDASLKRALQALPAATAPAELDVLSQRVLGDWQARHDRRGKSRPARPLAARLWRRRVWVGTAGLAAAALLATAILVTRPDPVLDELAQPDVLSEMAIGEM